MRRVTKRTKVLLTVPAVGALLLAACGTKQMSNVILPDTEAKLESISAPTFAPNVSGKQAEAILPTATQTATTEPSPTAPPTQAIVLPTNTLVVPTEVLPAQPAAVVEQHDSSENHDSDNDHGAVEDPTTASPTNTNIPPTAEPTITTTTPSAEAGVNNPGNDDDNHDHRHDHDNDNNRHHHNNDDGDHHDNDHDDGDHHHHGGH